jgi:nucleoside transporter
MMFLQYAITGSWSAVLGAYLGNPPPGADPNLYLKFTPIQIGAIFSLVPLAMVVAPLIFGQLADRVFATEYLIAVCNLFGAVVLVFVASADQYGHFFRLMGLYALISVPTFSLTNSIVFANIKDSEREFGGIRAWGTIGWLAAGLALAAWRLWLPPVKGDLYYLAAGISLLTGVYSFSLPHTPPQKEGSNPFALLEAFRLLKNYRFAVFVAIAFLLSTQVDFYYILISPFLEHLGFPRASVPAVMTLSNFAELFVMAFLLRRMLPKFGTKKLLVMGAIVWSLRYAMFAFLPAKGLVIAALPLHSIAFVFFFTVGFIYADQIADESIRASAQALLTTFVWGVARFLGSRFAGWVQGHYMVAGQTDFRMTFLVPCVATLVCALALICLLRDDKRTASEASIREPAAAK